MSKIPEKPIRGSANDSATKASIVPDNFSVTRQSIVPDKAQQPDTNQTSDKK